MNPQDIQTLKELIDQSTRAVAFTGAGISTESGVSDYRSKGGLWDRFQPVTIQEFLQDEDKRKIYWQRKKEMFAEMRQAQPNKGHLALAHLEKRDKLKMLITQNIDGFHQLAGTQNILEIHGTNREAICLDCKKIFPFEPVYERLCRGEEIPLCEACRGLLKPNTISFGQNLNPTVLSQCFQWAEGCDLMVVVGSTLVVEPAASLPRVAKEHSAKLVIVNRDPTPLDPFADLVVHETAGEYLEEVVG